MRRKVWPLAAVLPLVLLWARPAAGQEEIRERIAESQSRLDQIRDEQEQLRREMSRLAGEAHTMTEEIHNIERQIGSSAGVLAELELQTQAVAAQMVATTADMIRTRDELRLRRAELRERLREIYKRGPLHATQVMLEADSFGELISRYKYLHMVAVYDRLLVRQVARLEESLERNRETLAAEHAYLRGLRQQKSGEVEELERLERERQRRLRSVRSRSSAAENRLAALAAEEQRFRDLLVELERARREAERLAGAASTSTLETSDLGALGWPIDGAIVYGFGPERRGQTTITRRGIGIGAPVGTPVRVVEAGRVEWAGARGLLGEAVIVSHGGGYYSNYLYLTDLQVRIGEQVAAGQVIGHVGPASREGFGPMVEFRILEPGPGDHPRAVDPVRWLRGR